MKFGEEKHMTDLPQQTRWYISNASDLIAGKPVQQIKNAISRIVKIGHELECWVRMQERNRRAARLEAGRGWGGGAAKKKCKQMRKQDWKERRTSEEMRAEWIPKEVRRQTQLRRQ